MTCESLLIGLPALRHLRVDTPILLEESITSPHGTSCSLGDYKTVKTSTLGKFMTARLSRLQNNVAGGLAHLHKARSKASYHKAPKEEN